MDKISELKAIAEKAKELGGINNYKKGKDAVAAFIAAANPAVILALLAELKVKDKRISELEAKLAAPIKIVNYDEFFICHVTGASDDYCKGWVDGRNAAARDVGKAGFTVGDE
ncbi:hypothetical protein JOE25_002895 [Serratia sp. PL17]|uniref:ead/Ea22-like family protein n=1 Tax=Serratia sp. PL17 TaxID=2806582 RepID=UPI001B49F11D|nr:ead/Ea22-like family protein [Serratia sp. PL17]MBP1131315.1 hypothetical protein [Serratia sp. PL17]